MVVLLFHERESIPIHLDFDIPEAHFWLFALVVQIRKKTLLFCLDSAMTVISIVRQ